MLRLHSQKREGKREGISADGEVLEDRDRPNKDEDEEMKMRKKSSSVFAVDNIFWLTASMILFYLVQFPQVVLYDDRVDRFWLYLGLLLLSINLIIAIYFILFLSFIRKIPSEQWERSNPYAIPLATVAFVSSAMCFVLALWPVWSILTPFILFILFMGFIVVITILPEW